MDLVKMMRNYAQKVGGQFSEYDKEKSIIVVPVAEGRYQTIIGRYRDFQTHKKKKIEMSSKICKYKVSLDLTALLKENSLLHYARFSMVEDYLMLEASLFTDQLNEQIFTDMITEVAEVADTWEQRLTGVDVH